MTGYKVRYRSKGGRLFERLFGSHSELRSFLDSPPLGVIASSIKVEETSSIVHRVLSDTSSQKPIDKWSRTMSTFLRSSDKNTSINLKMTSTEAGIVLRAFEFRISQLNAFRDAMGQNIDAVITIEEEKKLISEIAFRINAALSGT